MKQQALINTDHLAEVDAESAELDRAYATKTQKAITQKREWYVEHVEPDSDQAASAAACANVLDRISNEDAGYLWDLKVSADGGFLLVWWRVRDA